MRIKSLTLENFKGISSPVKIEFKPITLLFGPNSAGKSTIVQALHYAQEILSRQNVDADLVAGADDSLNLGGFRNLVHGHDLSRVIRLQFEIGLDEDMFEPFPLLESEDDFYDWFYKSAEAAEPVKTHYDIRDSFSVETATVSLEIAWSNFFGRPFLKKYGIGFDGQHFASIEAKPDGKEVAITDFNHDHPAFFLHDEESPEPKAVPYFFILFSLSVKPSYFDYPAVTHLLVDGQDGALPRWNSKITIAENCFLEREDWYEGADVESYIQMIHGQLSQLFVRPGEILQRELERFCYIGPIRKIPARNYNAVRTDSSSRWANGLAAWDRLYLGSDEFITQVGEWMGSDNHLDSGFSIKVRRFKMLDVESPLYQALVNATFLDDSEDQLGQLAGLPERREIVIVDEKRMVQVCPQDIGVGISQLLPVVVGALDEEVNILAIEQPELHVHPSLQCRMGDLFIHQVHEQSDKMFLLETHS
ncbi:MAG: hypothetical protein D6698_14280, partial [Gammaproteobacteria bacterium]